ncbi:8-amino-7-oxononanoate synthase [Tenacibaculum adriaticum]|uniref:8-amino-7-oxononanoate synthase n=1 Tax=Tenacibaculum adriaticum TaxID=413713 RepID=A0A5S5DXK9_9FLAO|nr:pyridoxal phosphate-dependent aminotransferase family protein [Tenacibaculum adriaticum]TYP99998.1 8-amino-7-oxononanoate synthase [Tenacibaculum adriaticum]
MHFPKKLQNKVQQREENNTLRSLKNTINLIDFSSNDYLGFAKSEVIFEKTHQFLIDKNIKINGATGSRLLSGNHFLHTELEKHLSNFHNSESALIFNSGYDASLGFFSSILQRGDIILFDEYIHASIRDGIQLSNAKSFKFKHNNIEELEKLLIRHSNSITETQLNVYIVTESIFSMDGDTPDLIKINNICKKHNALLIIDEAHALGVFGLNGCGLSQHLNLEKDIFARIVTFGKGLGCHGAVILGSEKLTQYLVNFARSFIYTTGLSPHSLATIKIAYEELNNSIINKLHQNIHHFKTEIKRLSLSERFIESNSAIHCCVISGNTRTQNIAEKLQQKGFDIKPILSPTVSEGKERLRFCLHSYNSTKEITNLLENLATFVN